MAVTKIRKISSWTLLLTSVISLVVLGLFFGGGVVNPGEEMKEYVYTALLINWMYVVFALAAVSTLIFACWQFASSLKTDPKGSFMGLAVIVLFFGLLFLTYAIGDGTPLGGMNADSQKYNTEFWLKTTDMWIYSTYVLVGLIVLAAAAGTVRRIISK